MRSPVPTIEQCGPTIQREARYWAPRFRRVLSYDDLVQEGWMIAFKVLRYYDPARGAKMPTLLTLALRRHFARLIKTTLTRALCYNDAQRSQLTSYLQLTEARSDPERAVMARLLLARLWTLPHEQQRLARDLLDENGKTARVARRNRWSLRATRARIALLRAALTPKK